MKHSQRTQIRPPTQSSINVFVIGDLVLDHAIFVRRPEKPHQPIGNEKVTEVVRRVTMAGGAANCARALASIGRGQVFLWGITGQSPWGDFSDILDRSQTYDGAVRGGRVQLRALHDHSIKMNTITRLIVLRDDSQEHEHRFDDTGEVRLTEAAHKTALDELCRAHIEPGIHAVIVNDLDMGTITSDLIKGIARFCQEHSVPLFIDPKRTVGKYQEIRATAILPNLHEWCQLVGQGGRDKHWRDKLRNKHGLQEVAAYSLEHLPHFAYHVIKCDRDGAVLIGPAQGSTGGFAAFNIPPHPAMENRELPHQLGTGDVVTAILAMEFVALGSPPVPIDKFSDAFNIANRVVSAYRQNPWHRMPTLQDIDRLTTAQSPISDMVPITAPRLYLPRDGKLSLVKAGIPFTQLVSVDEAYRQMVEDVLSFFRGNWAGETLKSGFLSARGGSGKSQLCSDLGKIMAAQEIGFEELRSQALEKIKTVRDFRKHIESLRKQSGHKHYLIVIDEAFAHAKHLLRKKTGVTLLQCAEDNCVRLLLVDADLEAHRNVLSASQFDSRIQYFHLPDIDKRPKDIPFVFAAGCVKGAADDHRPIVCEEAALLGVIDAALSMQRTKQSARTIFGWGKTAGACATKTGRDDEIRITKMVLPAPCQQRVPASVSGTQLLVVIK